MSDESVLIETDKYRLLIETEVYPEQPDFDGQGQILRFDGRFYETLQTEKSPSLIGEVQQGWERWTDMDMIERYLRLFHDVVGFDYFDTQDAKYVCVVTLEDLKVWGFTDAKAYELATGRDNPAEGVLKVWQAWVDGECYGFVVQEKQTWRRVDAGHTFPKTVRETWETIEAIGGFYGREDVEESAKEFLAGYTSWTDEQVVG